MSSGLLLCDPSAEHWNKASKVWFKRFIADHRIFIQSDDYTWCDTWGDFLIMATQFAEPVSEETELEMCKSAIP